MPKSFVDGVRALVSIHLTSSTLVREFHSERVYDRNTEGSHLATRAWALQERILPSRTGTGVYRNGEENDSTDEIRLDGLVLQKVLIDSKAFFSRIGMFQYFKDQASDHDDSKRERFELFVAEFEREASRVAEGLALEKLEKQNLFIVFLI